MDDEEFGGGMTWSIYTLPYTNDFEIQTSGPK